MPARQVEELRRWLLRTDEIAEIVRNDRQMYEYIVSCALKKNRVGSTQRKAVRHLMNTVTGNDGAAR